MFQGLEFRVQGSECRGFKVSDFRFRADEELDLGEDEAAREELFNVNSLYSNSIIPSQKSMPSRHSLQKYTISN